MGDGRSAVAQDWEAAVNPTEFRLVDFTLTFKGKLKVAGEGEGGALGGIGDSHVVLETGAEQYEAETNARLVDYLAEALYRMLMKRKQVAVKEEVKC
jgi:hypothetical protein